MQPHPLGTADLHVQYLASCIAHINPLFADRKSGKFSKSGKLEIQQKWKFNKTGNSKKWKFNKNRKTGNSTNSNPMKLHCQEFRCPGEQEFRKTMVCPSGTLPLDIPQIWNGRFCTLIGGACYKGNILCRVDTIFPLNYEEKIKIL